MTIHSQLPEYVRYLESSQEMPAKEAIRRKDQVQKVAITIFHKIEKLFFGQALGSIKIICKSGLPPDTAVMLGLPFFLYSGVMFVLGTPPALIRLGLEKILGGKPVSPKKSFETIFRLDKKTIETNVKKKWMPTELGTFILEHYDTVKRVNNKYDRRMKLERKKHPDVDFRSPSRKAIDALKAERDKELSRILHDFQKIRLKYIKPLIDLKIDQQIDKRLKKMSTKEPFKGMTIEAQASSVRRAICEEMLKKYHFS